MRKHKQRRVFALVLTFVVLLCVSGLHAFAATVTQDGLEVTLVTDKAEYSANEQIKTTLTVKNNNDTAVENVDLETAIPEGYILADKAENKKTVESVAAGESVSLEVTLVKKSTPDEPSTDPKSSTNSVSGGNNGGSGTTTGGTTAGGTKSGAAVQTGQSGLVFAICLIALLLSSAAIWFFKTHGEIKNKNTVKRIISLVLCISVLSGTLFVSGLPVFAEESAISGKSLTISEEIKVGETKLIISANVVYNKEDKTVDDNITKLSDDMYITNPQAEHVRYDEESGIPYIDNEILITFNQDVEEATIEAYVSSLGGTIIGKIAPTNTYQVQVPVCEKFSDVESIIAQIEANEIVDFASPDILMIEKPDAYYPYNDTEWKDEWSTFPKGNNWGVEAIKAPEAWEYLDSMQNVNVGLIDTKFLNHSDLHFEDIMVNSNNYTKQNTHGTHVAGTIGAGFDNGVGISGVAPKAKLYGCGSFRMDELITNRETVRRFIPEEGWDDYDITSITRMNLMLTYLIIQCHCRVVNYSMGISEDFIYAANENEPHALNYLNAWSEALEPYLLNLINNNPDFNIVSAAGNVNDDYYVNDRNSNNGYYGYKKSNMFQLGAKHGNIPANISSTFNYINNPIIKERVIVVGAVENKTKNTVEAYSLCDFSNIGERVDVVAPGKDIVSTVDNNGYDVDTGTSMAAPHVTGIAAMLYSLNPDIKADEVKRIICETADREVDGYKLVNAEAAVKAVMGTGTIGGKVVSAKDGSALSDIKITAYQKLKSGLFPVEFNTNDQGGFSKELISGNYEFNFEKEGYQTLTMDITVDKNVITLLQFNIELQPIGTANWQKRNDGKIYFYNNSAISDCDNYLQVYIYNCTTSKELAPAGSKYLNMTDEGNSIWSFDLDSVASQKEFELNDEQTYSLTITNSWGYFETNELLFNTDCLGDMVYLTGETIEDPHHQNKKLYVTKWVNSYE